MVQINKNLVKTGSALALALGLVTTLSGCDVAAALRHEDEVAQSVSTPANSASNNASNNAASHAKPAEPTGQNWTDGELSQTHCDDSVQTLKGIRVGRHNGFDRIVFDLTGSAEPCYRVYFDPDPVQDGSGNPISLNNGYQALRVEISGLGPEFPTIVPGYSVQLGGTAVGYAFFDTFFEGVATNFIAVHDGGAQFSVDTLPGKLIVDVRTATS